MKLALTTLYFLRNGSLSLPLAALTPSLVFITPQARRILYVFWGWLFNSSGIVWRDTEDIIERAGCKWVCGLNVMCEWWHHLPPRHATGAASSNTHHYMSAGWKDWFNRRLLKISMHANGLNAGQNFPIG